MLLILCYMSYLFSPDFNEKTKNTADKKLSDENHGVCRVMVQRDYRVHWEKTNRMKHDR